MRCLSIIALCALATSVFAAAAATVEFDGQRFTLNYSDQATLSNGQPGDGIAEFTLAGETVQDWSKLFAFHAYPEMGDDPVAAVQAVGKAVKENNKDANFAIITNDKNGEAIIDFLTWAPDSDIMEFNVFKYARAADGRGLIALQYAQHVKLGDIDVAGMRALREHAVDEMAFMSMIDAHKYFADRNARSAAKSTKDDGSSLARAGGER